MKKRIKTKKYHIFLLLLCVTAIGIFFIIRYINTDKTVNHRMQWHMETLFGNNNPLDYIGDNKVTIAVIDSGIDDSHADLTGCVTEKYLVSGLDKNNNTDNEHGTFVCGIISGFPKSNDGVLGINSNVNIISIDISDNNGIADIDKMIEAIDYAISKRVDIINISVMTKNDNEKLHMAVKRAYDNGIVIVAAAGNDTDEKIGYPAGYEEVLSVGAYTKIGMKMYSELENTIYLPGKNIVSTSSGDKLYSSNDGTSVATPVLTGIVSLILSKKNISNLDIMECFSDYYGKRITDINEIYDYFGLSH